jgi:murein DD-endopeptidase MepM/ murein hydrolase activator NlpD
MPFMRFENKTKLKQLSLETFDTLRTSVRQIHRSSVNLAGICKVKAKPALHTLSKVADVALAGARTGATALCLPVLVHKRIILQVVFACAVLTMFLFVTSSAHTVYEYSVGGQVLGVVKDKDMVTRAVESSGSSVRVDSVDRVDRLVEEEVAGSAESTDSADSTDAAVSVKSADIADIEDSEDSADGIADAARAEESKVVLPAKNGTSVIIDKEADIVVEEKIVTEAKDNQVDNSEEIIDKITKLEDVNIIAYTFRIDDKVFGPFESSEAIQSVLDRVKEYWLGAPVPAKYKEVGFENEVVIDEISTPKAQFTDPGATYDEIMKGVLEYRDYTVKDGDTLFDIAAEYDITIDKIAELNPDVDPENIHTGDKLRLEEEKAVLSVRTVEEIEYDETFKANPVYNDTDKLYEGEEIVTSEGSKGKRHVKADLININGKASEVLVTDTEVLKKSVADEIMRGTKKLPPLIGKGYFIRPANAGITSGFKYRWGRHHDGIDIGIRYGSVVAADGGEVIYAGNRGDGYGNKIIINHGGGRQTLYAHLSEIDVHVGEKVYQGQRIATSGNTGSSTGPHLHFEVHINGVPKDPTDYL